MRTGSEHFLVTGAAGCIGAWVVRHLLDDGIPVTASDVSEDARGRGSGSSRMAATTRNPISCH